MKLKKKGRKAIKAIALAATVPAGAFAIGFGAGSIEKVVGSQQPQPQQQTTDH